MFRSCFRMLAVILIFVSQTLKSLSECMHRIPSGMPQCQRLQESLRPHGPQGFSPPYTPPPSLHTPPPTSCVCLWLASCCSFCSFCCTSRRPAWTCFSMASSRRCSLSRLKPTSPRILAPCSEWLWKQSVSQSVS